MWLGSALFETKDGCGFMDHPHLPLGLALRIAATRWPSRLGSGGSILRNHSCSMRNMETEANVRVANRGVFRSIHEGRVKNGAVCEGYVPNGTREHPSLTANWRDNGFGLVIGCQTPTGGAVGDANVWVFYHKDAATE